MKLRQGTNTSLQKPEVISRMNCYLFFCHFPLIDVVSLNSVPNFAGYFDFEVIFSIASNIVTASSSKLTIRKNGMGTTQNLTLKITLRKFFGILRYKRII